MMTALETLLAQARTVSRRGLFQFGNADQSNFKSRRRQPSGLFARVVCVLR
jgi:hypothetical protein